MANPVPPPLDPVRRLMPSLEISNQGMGEQQRFLEIIARNIANAENTRTPEGGPYQRQIGLAGGGVQDAANPGRLVYDPAHPDANEDGFVEYPNVDVQTELVDLMIVRRMYEANATVFAAAKRMLQRALEI